MGGPEMADKGVGEGNAVEELAEVLDKGQQFKQVEKEK